MVLTQKETQEFIYDKLHEINGMETRIVPNPVDWIRSWPDINDGIPSGNYVILESVKEDGPDVVLSWVACTSYLGLIVYPTQEYLASAISRVFTDRDVFKSVNAKFIVNPNSSDVWRTDYRFETVGVVDSPAIPLQAMMPFSMAT